MACTLRLCLRYPSVSSIAMTSLLVPREFAGGGHSVMMLVWGGLRLTSAVRVLCG